jgi:hypothetical protein
MSTTPPRARTRDRWKGESAKINPTIPAALKAEIEAIAAADGVTLSAVVRRALEAERDRHA